MDKRKVKDLRIGSKVWVVQETKISQLTISQMDINGIYMGSVRSHIGLTYIDISEKDHFLIKSIFSTFAFCNLEDAVKELRVQIQKKIDSNNEKIKDLLDENFKYVEQLNTY